MSIKNPKVLKGIIVLILDKALNEPAYSALYAQLCQRLDKCVPNFEPPTSLITTFRKLLLTVCQHEFDNRANYFNNTNDTISSAAAKKIAPTTNNSKDDRRSPANYAEKGVAFISEEEKLLTESANQMSKKKMLGNVKFIGELGRLDLLNEAILHKCIKTLLEKQPDEKYADMSSDLECLCKMMPTIGRKLDQGEAVKLMDQYFKRMKKLSLMGVNVSGSVIHSKDVFPQRIRFLLQDCIDLREYNWQPRQTQIDQAPKTMHEVRNTMLGDDMNHSKQSLEAAAAINQGLYGSGGIPANYLSTSASSSSSVMMNMLQHFSQQPNMTLLNAINGMTINKIMSKKVKTDLINEKNAELNLTETNKDTVTTQNYLTNKITTIGTDNISNNQTSMDVNISNTNVDIKSQQPYSNVNRVNRKTSHVSWLSSLNQYQNQPTPTQLQQQNPNPTHIKPYNNTANTKTTTPNNIKTLSFFSVNSNTTTTDQKINYSTNNNTIASETNNNKTEGQQRSVSSSSSSKLSSDGSSSSVSPPLAPATLNTNNIIDLSANTNITNKNNNNLELNNQKNFNKFNNKIPLTSFDSNSNSNKRFYNNQNNTNSINPNHNNTNFNSWDSSNNKKVTNTTLPASEYPLTSEIPSNSMKNQTNNFNSYLPQNNQYSQQNSSRFSNTYPHQNYNNYNNHNNQRVNFNRGALGVSTNEVLPLNKPIIPLKDVLKLDNKHGKSQSKALQNHPNATTTATSATVTATALISSLEYQTPIQYPAKSSKQFISNETKLKIRNILDDYFLNDNDSTLSSSSDDSSSSSSSTPTSPTLPLNENSETCMKLLKQLHLNSEQTSEMISLIIIHTLSKTDLDRSNTSKLFIEFHENTTESLLSISSDMFMSGFKVVLQNLSNLESEYHFVKSHISMYAARAVCDQIISVSDLAHLMKYGDYYPLFFLCMQNMHKLKTPEWLRNQLEQSKINLVDMLPAADRNKERLVQILEDRELSFVYPMLKIESTLMLNIQADLSSVELKQWIEGHVDLDIRMSIGFIQSLVSCIVKNAAESSLLSEDNEENNKANFNSKMDKIHVAKQKQSIEKYQDLLQEYLSSKLTKQVEAIYAMQVYASSKGFPKYFLAHLFNQMYDLEIIDEEAFYLWKDEINENYPDKGQALFHLQRWFNWLQEASEESSDGESEKNSTTKRKTQNQAKMLQNVEEINVDLTASIK